MLKYAMAESASRRPKWGHAGFTLLEITVAMAVVATVALAAFNLQNQGFRSYINSRQMTHAVLLAQEKLTEAQISLASADEQGKFETPSGEILLWSVQVKETNLPKLKIVRIEIRVPDSVDPILEAETYVAGS